MASVQAAEETGSDQTTPPPPLCSGFWYEVLTQHARERGEALAVTQKLPEGHYASIDYAALHAKVCAYARLFSEATAPGQIIPLCLARGIECVAAMLGALVSGRAFCCVNQKLRLPQIELILGRLTAPVALLDGPGLLSLRGEHEAASPVLSTRWFLVGGTPQTRAARRVLDELSTRARIVSLEASVEAAADLDPRSAQADTKAVTGEGQVGACLFTSGSTGAPKGVLIACDDLRARAEVEAAWLALRADDVVLNVLPFSFDVGLNQVLSTVLVGAELVVLESWLPADILGAVAARGVTGIAAVPTIWADFMAKQRVFEVDGAHRTLRYLTISGGDLSEAQHQHMPALAPGVRVYKTYGQTEAFRIAALHPDDYPSRPRSVGKALPGGRLYIARAEGGLAAPGELGEVVHTGTGAMLAYLSEGVDETKLRWNPWHGPDDPRALAVFTGDLGYVDEEGYLFLAGRRDDLVKVSGNRVYPAEVQGLISAVPGVAAAEVVAVKVDDQTRLAAFVVPVSDAVIEPAQLRRQLQERAPSYMIPELLRVEAELPRTASGKPDRTRLANLALELLKQGIVVSALVSIGLPIWS